MPGGRPTDYNEEIAALICLRTATHSVGLNKLCDMYDDMPSKFTVNLWRYKYPEFSTLYAKAKLKQADLLAEECLEIADEKRVIEYDKEGNPLPVDPERISQMRLKIDTRKWLASKLLPKQYGEAAKGNDEGASSTSLLEKIISGEIKLNKAE